MNLKQRQNKKTKKPSNNIPNWAVSLIVTFGILLYFILGSWQLSFVIDQLKCKNKLPNCLLPSNPYSVPYRPNTTKHADLMDIFERAKSAGENWSILELLKKVFGITPNATNKSMTGGNVSKRAKKINNFLTEVDIDGYKPFDIFNGPPSWPYSWADEPSNWETGYFSQWFGNMQINSWSSARGILYGYLSLFSSLTDNLFTRFILTWCMPVIISLSIVLQPLVSFISCLWGNFSAGIAPWGVVFFFIPIITMATMVLHNIQMITYMTIGGIIGSGPTQVSKNLNLDTGKGYGRIMQAILAMGLIISLILFIVDKTSTVKK